PHQACSISGAIIITGAAVLLQVFPWALFKNAAVCKVWPRKCMANDQHWNEDGLRFQGLEPTRTIPPSQPVIQLSRRALYRTYGV
ncbi:hypothetical protein ALQ45_00830, partial [Pseudomonas amygdali pv. morsprunorum]